MPAVLRVGVTGGIGSGKSSVAARLRALGAHVVDADAVAREVVEPGTRALEMIRNRFGDSVIRADGGLDRAELAAIVFADREAYPIPDLILLDLKMPLVDGQDVLRAIKNVDRLRRIPVVVLSSSKEEGDRALSYDNGANSYLVKPVSFEGFRRVVRLIDDYWLTLNEPPPL